MTFVTAGALFAVDLTGYGRPMHLTTTGTTVTISRGDTHVIAQAINGGSDADLKAAFTALGVRLGQTTGFPVDGISADRWDYDEDDTHRAWWLDLSDRGERPW